MVSGTGIIFAVAENFPAPFLSQCPTWDKFSRCLPCQSALPPALHIELLPVL